MYNGLFVITSIPDIAHTGISACVTHPFTDFQEGPGDEVKCCIQSQQFQAKKSKVYHFEMLQTNLVNFSLVV